MTKTEELMQYLAMKEKSMPLDFIKQVATRAKKDKVKKADIKRYADDAIAEYRGEC